MNKLDNDYITKFDNYETGFNSITHDKKHVLLWDFDNDNIRDITECLIEIQKYFNLSTVYILSSRNGYNAICLDKFSDFRAFYIKSLTILSDKKHDVIGYKRNGWVLRMGEDKKIDSILYGNHRNYPKSNAHRELLNKLFNYSINKTLAYDNFTDILFEKYKRKPSEVENEKENKIRNGIPEQSKRIYRLE